MKTLIFKTLFFSKNVPFFSALFISLVDLTSDNKIIGRQWKWWSPLDAYVVSYPTHTKYLEWYLTFIYQKNYSFFVTIFYSRHQRVQLVMGFDIWVSTFVQQIPRIYAKEKSSIMLSNKIHVMLSSYVKIFLWKK